MGARGLSLLLVALGAFFASGAAEKLQEVEVRPGDTLWGIAQTYLKDPRRWNEILRYNKLPTADPTVALPGMTLAMPVNLIKEELRAAKLVQAVRKVLCRPKDTAAWDTANVGRQLFRGDALRTLADSWARVQFLSGGLLSLEPNSMAILKPPKQEDHELKLLNGAIHATIARVVTPSAYIKPKSPDTKYSARVLEDLNTRVQVYRGAADVRGGGKNVEVRGGFATDVPLGQAPSVPYKMPAMALAEEAPDEGFKAAKGAEFKEALLSVRGQETLGAAAPDLKIHVESRALEIGIPIAAYFVQVSRSRSFEKILYEKFFEREDPIDFPKGALPDGQYWVRVSPVDLLGTRGKFSEPKLLTLGAAKEVATDFSGLFEVTLPDQADTFTRTPRYKIVGKADKGLNVTVNGEAVPVGSDGVFGLDVILKEGVNSYEIKATDLRGNEKALTRRIVYQP